MLMKVLSLNDNGAATGTSSCTSWRKLMFFEDLLGGPALRTIELHHIALAIFVLKLVNAVLIAVKRSETGVHPFPDQISHQ
jgi:hypothetical protein